MWARQLITSQRIYFSVLIASAFLAGLTLTSLFGRHWVLELATHFRLQYAVGATLCAVILIGFHSWKVLPIPLACAILNWALIFPYYSTPARPAASSAGVHLKLMLANVLGTSKNYAALNAVVSQEQPDIIVLQEFTEAWRSNVNNLTTLYPYSKLAPKAGGSGMALFSRYEIEVADVLEFDTSGHPALHVRANVQGTKLSILALHPPTPVRWIKFANRNLQFTSAAPLIKADPDPKLLIGDLNTTMWSPYFGDLVKGSGLRDARLGFGLQASWPMPLPAPLRIPIDHCLVSDDISIQRIRIGGRTGSDHRPLIVDLNLPKSTLQAGR